MRRHFSPGTLSYSFGPGPMSYAVKILIWTNVAAFLATWFAPVIKVYLGLQPAEVLGHYWLWQPVTYMFIHDGPWHILWNMLVLWMFGVELERRWGTRFFVKFYFVSGIAGAALTLLFSVLPFSFGAGLFNSLTIGASGAIFGLLLAYAIYFPDRRIYMYFLFAVPARYFVLIMGAITFLLSLSNVGSTAYAAHLGGLAGGYLFLKLGRGRPLAELKGRYLKWRFNRLRGKFDIYSGGKAKDWERRIH